MVLKKNKYCTKTCLDEAPKGRKKYQAFMTHIDNASQFFVNLAGEEQQERLQKITEHILQVNPETTDTPDGWGVNVEEKQILAAFCHGDGL